MCYLIAKERNAHGCIALKTTHGQHLADFKLGLLGVVSFIIVKYFTIICQSVLSAI